MLEGFWFSRVVSIHYYVEYSFRLHEILPSLKVQLGGKTITIEVEVVDAPLDYNLLLEWNWMYSMQAIAASLFRVV